MAYDEDLAGRIREVLEAEDDIGERQMFGGLAFLVAGNMAVAASGQGGLMVRVDPADAPQLLAGEGVRRMDMKGRALDGWLLVDASALRTEQELADWVGTGVAYARRLPAKAAGPRRG